MPFYPAAHLCLAVLMSSMHVQADSAVFSNFIGATTASGPSSGNLGYSFLLCEDFLHQLPGFADFPPKYSTQLQQGMVDGVCQFCTSLEQSRIDSCCPQATSSACFDQFVGVNAAQTRPASAVVTPTATLPGGSSLKPTSSSNSGVIAKVRPV